MLSGKEIYYLDLQLAAKIPKVFAERIQHVREYRLSSQNKEAERLADRPHSWGVQTTIHNGSILVIPTNSSKNYAVLPVVLVDPYEYTLPHQYVVCNSTVYFVEDGSLFSFGVLQSSMHRAWCMRCAERTAKALVTTHNSTVRLYGRHRTPPPSHA